MRKIISFALIMLGVAFSYTAHANVFLKIDSDELIKTDEAYFLPVRKVFESLDATVLWENENRKIEIFLNNSKYALFADDNKILINDAEDEIKVPVRIFDDRAYICLCAMDKFGDFSFALDKENNIAEITMFDKNISVD